MVFLQDLHFQIPVDSRLMAVFPQKVQGYLLCLATSIFLQSFLRVAPYLTPYFPVIPTFFVRFPILFYSGGGGGVRRGEGEQVLLFL